MDITPTPTAKLEISGYFDSDPDPLELPEYLFPLTNC